MAIIKLTLSEEHYQKLKDMAQEEKKSVQDYIRDKIFDEESIFTPEEAVIRAIEKFSDGKLFTLPDVYGDDWKIKRGPAGVFGKRFFNYVQDNECRIKFVGMDTYGRRAQYKVREILNNEQ